jgi:Fungal chitosanase of glycosyl hydrolase group 75
MQVNADGAPDSYHPDDVGITHICNGVSVGQSCTWKPKCLFDFRQAKAEHFNGPTKICFFAMATDALGVPIIQGEADPKPGYFVSTTALKQAGEDIRTPQAQLDSNTVPFAVVPGTWQRSGKPGPKLGDFGVAYRRSNGKAVFFVIGDTGPRNKLGEGSVALHLALGNDPFVMRSGVRRADRGIGGKDVAYLMFPNSAQVGKKFNTSMIDQLAGEQLRAFGGIERLKACADSLAD